MHGMDRKDGYKTQKTTKRTKGQTIKTETNGQFQGTNGHIENQRINIIKDKERVERTKPWMPGKNVRSTMIGEMVKYWRRLREEHKIENLNPTGCRALALSLTTPL